MRMHKTVKTVIHPNLLKQRHEFMKNARKQMSVGIPHNSSIKATLMQEKRDCASKSSSSEQRNMPTESVGGWTKTNCLMGLEKFLAIKNLPKPNFTFSLLPDG